MSHLSESRNLTTPEPTATHRSRRRGRLASTAGLIAMAGAPLLSIAATSISSDMYSVPGNGPIGGYPGNYPTTAGVYQLGPLSGYAGGNSATANLTLQAFPQPGISSSAVGWSNGVDGNYAHAQVDATITFDFYVQGPQSGVAVPLLIAGSTYGLYANAGDPSGWYNQVGTQIKFTAPDVATAATLHAVGAQTGTPAEVYLGFQSAVSFASWGTMSPGPVDYTQYSGSFLFGATVQSSATALTPGLQTLTLREHVIGGDNVGGQPFKGRNTYSLGATSASLGELMYIDPAWAATHPGYTLVVDSGVGNVAAVPEPSRAALIWAGLLAVGWMARRRTLRDRAR